MKKKPKISVITIVYNGENFIKKTIESVIQQTYSNLEYIIIDGKSTDRTLATIAPYQNKISTCVSEPDKGIYDAMNKGLDISTGDFVVFMNAGDTFYDATILEKIIAIDNGLSDIYYGETMYLNESFEEIGIRSEFTPHKLPAKLSWKNMKFGMVVCHQSIMIRKNCSSKYNLNYKFCSDIDWIINALKKTNRVVNIHSIFSNYLKGGISDKRHKESLADRFQVLKKHFGLIHTVICHLWIIIRALKRKIIL